MSTRLLLSPQSSNGGCQTCASLRRFLRSSNRGSQMSFDNICGAQTGVRECLLAFKRPSYINQQCELRYYHSKFGNPLFIRTPPPFPGKIVNYCIPQNSNTRIDFVQIIRVITVGRNKFVMSHHNLIGTFKYNSIISNPRIEPIVTRRTFRRYIWLVTRLKLQYLNQSLYP